MPTITVKQNEIVLRALAATIVGGEAGVALALVVVSVRAWWHTVAPGAASPARSVTKVWST